MNKQIINKLHSDLSRGVACCGNLKDDWVLSLKVYTLMGRECKDDALGKTADVKDSYWKKGRFVMVKTEDASA